MKAKELWYPTKFILKKGHLRSSKNKIYIHVASFLATDIVAMHYSKIIKTHFKGKLIDLGCGDVPFYEAYKDYIDENICVDWENTLHTNKYLDFSQNLNEPLKFENNSFDTALLSDVLEHIRKPDNLISEINRILKNRGKLILNVPFYYYIHEEPYDYFRYTRFAIKSMLEDSGFNIILLQPLGGIPEVLTDIFSKTFHHVPLIGKSVVRLCQWLCFLFVKTKIGKKISNKTAHKFPYGYIVVAEKM